jgi:hypothetical protein
MEDEKKEREKLTESLNKIVDCMIELQATVSTVKNNYKKEI